MPLATRDISLLRCIQGRKPDAVYPQESTYKNRFDRRTLLKGAAASAVGILAAPMVVRAENKSIKIGMTTILSGRVAQLGTSSRNAVMMEVEKINAAGGLAGRQIEMVIRNSKGQPQEAGADRARTDQHRRLRIADRRGSRRPALSPSMKWRAISAC